MSSFIFSFGMGLKKEKITSILKECLNKNADLLIGIDDPEVNQLINVLVKGITEVIVANNKELERNLEKVLEKYKPNSNNGFNRRRYF